MLAVVGFSVLIRVDDEEEAARYAMMLANGAEVGAKAEMEASALKLGVDQEELEQAIEKGIAFLGPQVSILPEVVVSG